MFEITAQIPGEPQRFIEAVATESEALDQMAYWARTLPDQIVSYRRMPSEKDAPSMLDVTLNSPMGMLVKAMNANRRAKKQRTW
tara:strand:- start:394 stop:645 length:252 start_codon:yes stop_codon:yes gene_type:complete